MSKSTLNLFALRGCTVKIEHGTFFVSPSEAVMNRRNWNARIVMLSPREPGGIF